jgi:hypothetical protein
MSMALKHKFRHSSAQPTSSMFASGRDTAGRGLKAGLSAPARLRIILALSFLVWILVISVGWMLCEAIR